MILSGDDVKSEMISWIVDDYFEKDTWFQMKASRSLAAHCM